jgi:DNA mismatch endonuclease (patch repair protein)
MPKSRTNYWLPKLNRNADRDWHSESLLEANGWRVLTVWACETKDEENLATKLREFLGGRTALQGL